MYSCDQVVELVLEVRATCLVFTLASVSSRSWSRPRTRTLPSRLWSFWLPVSSWEVLFLVNTNIWLWITDPRSRKLEIQSFWKAPWFLAPHDHRTPNPCLINSKSPSRWSGRFLLMLSFLSKWFFLFYLIFFQLLHLTLFHWHRLSWAFYAWWCDLQSFGVDLIWGLGERKHICCHL